MNAKLSIPSIISFSKLASGPTAGHGNVLPPVQTECPWLTLVLNIFCGAMQMLVKLIRFGNCFAYLSQSPLGNGERS